MIKSEGDKLAETRDLAAQLRQLVFNAEHQDKLVNDSGADVQAGVHT